MYNLVALLFTCFGKRGDYYASVESGDLYLSGSGFVVVCVVLFQTRGVWNCKYILLVLEGLSKDFLTLWLLIFSARC